MKMHDKCLPCMVNQVIKVANITGVNNKEELLKEVLHISVKWILRQLHQKLLEKFLA